VVYREVPESEVALTECEPKGKRLLDLPVESRLLLHQPIDSASVGFRRA
jgi:hypothetical protein